MPPAPSVLIVDDEAPVRYVLSKVVEMAGARPFCAESAAEAVALIHQHEFASAFIDKNLVGDDGMAVLRVLREAQKDCNALVITAYGNLESAQDALRLGAFDYVLKPFDLSAVQHRLTLALERFTLARDRESLQTQVLQAERLAALGQLAAGIIHEINTPLSYVLANIEYLSNQLLRAPADTPSIDNWRQILTEAREGAQRLANLTRDIRVFAHRPTDGPELLEVAQVLESIVKIATVQVRHRASLVRDYTPAPPVLAVEGKLAQVLLNLIVNAAQSFTTALPSRNRITVHTGTAPAGEAVIEIRDNGPGIPPHVRERMFEPFFTTKPAGEGTGLGLSISRSIVDSLGGALEVETELGQGTVFRIRLPPPTGYEKRRSQAREVAPGRRGRILAVDDEPAIGVAIARILEADHDVVAAASAPAALQYLRTGDSFDAVVCDLVMPDVSGAELYATLQADYPDLAARTLFVTAGATEPWVNAFIAKHPDRCLTKPIDSIGLRQALRSLIR